MARAMSVSLGSALRNSGDPFRLPGAVTNGAMTLQSRSQKATTSARRPEMHQQGEVVDTYLLRVLKTLLDERSVTRAAIHLNQSQPAVSAALRRLRGITGDPLLVRGKSGMVPTEYALQLVEPARRALGEIEKITIQQATFSPSDSVRRFRIGCPDYLSASFIPAIVKIFRHEAPAALLEFVSPGPSFDVKYEMETGRVDLVVGNWPEPPKQLRRAVLLSDEVVCLVGSHHRLAAQGEITVEDYQQAAHIAPITSLDGAARCNRCAPCQRAVEAKACCDASIFHSGTLCIGEFRPNLYYDPSVRGALRTTTSVEGASFANRLSSD
jgi:DNA-binding transcriptional LysR family regulator